MKLAPFVVPPARIAGLVAEARINGGPKVRLLLDSGTQFLVMNRKTALQSGCTGGSDLDLVGAGTERASAVKVLKAATVQIGGLAFRDVPVLVASNRLPDGIQGVLPLAIFDPFLIRLNIPERNLDLLPYPSEAADGGALKAVMSNRLLFIEGTVNGKQGGYFLLDTGAAYTAISQELAGKLCTPRDPAAGIPLHGGTRDIDAPLVANTLQLRFGARPLTAGPVVAIDLGLASRYHRIEVSGLLGYQALANSVLTVSYRDGSVRIDSR